MDITIGTTTISTTSDQDAGLSQQAGDTPIEQYLVTRMSSILADASQRTLQARAEAVRQAFLNSTPDQKAAIEASVSVPPAQPPIKVQ